MAFSYRYVSLLAVKRSCNRHKVYWCIIPVLQLIILLTDEQMMQLIDEAKNGGYTMKVRHAKILFCGASGAGKTSFVRLRIKNLNLINIVQNLVTLNKL